MSYADIIKKKEKEWDYPNLAKGGNSQRGEKIQFSSPLFNWCTYGGIPRDKITEFYGDFGSGKSTTAQDICKNAIIQFETEFNTECDILRNKMASGDKSAEIKLDELVESGPKKVTYFDIEHTYDSDWASKLGLDSSKIDVLQPPNVVAEEILQMILDIVETGEVGLVVLDSIPALVPKTVLDKDIGERTVAALAGIITTFCTKIVSMLTRYKCTLLVINQIRDNLNNPYVVNTPGGKALKFFTSLRMQYRIGKPVDFLGNELPQNTENPAGFLVTATITKQKSAPNDRRNGTYYLMCQSGIRPDFDYALLAINKYGFIKKAAAWFTMCDPYTGEVLTETILGKEKPIKVNGMARVYDYLNSNQEYYNKIKNYINDDINNKAECDDDETD